MLRFQNGLQDLGAKVPGHQDIRTTWNVEIFSSFHTFIDFLIEALPEGLVQARGGRTGVEQF